MGRSEKLKKSFFKNELKKQNERNFPKDLKN